MYLTVFLLCCCCLLENNAVESIAYTLTQVNGTSPTIAQILADAPEDGGYLAAKSDGDVVIGGLFAIHIPDGDILCGKFGRLGVAVEAMIYSTGLINKRDDVLPNITLGFDIRDDCSDYNKALQETLVYVKKRPGAQSCELYHPPVIGIVGTGKSSTSRSVNELVGLFQLPQISYAATSSLLSDKSQFPYFLRTVPSENNRVKVMADLTNYFNWNYVHIIYTDDEFGSLGSSALEKELVAVNACVAARSHKVDRYSSDEDILQIILTMKENEKAEVVFVFCFKSHAERILIEAVEQKLFGLTWVTGDTWALESDFVAPYRDVLTNIIGIAPKYEFEKDGFVSYLKSLDLTENTRNPWYITTIKNYFNCEFEEEATNISKICHGNETLESFASTFHGSVVNAVQVFAYGLHAILQSCENEECINFETLDTQKYLEFLRNVSFETANNSSFQFDSNGDPMTPYQLHFSQGFDYEIIGEWQPDNGIKFTSEIIWSNSNGAPLSICSFDCKAGQYKIQQSLVCCWTCENCQIGYISSSVNPLTCTKCPSGERTNENQTACLVNPYDFLEWTDIEAIVLCVITSLGLIITFAFLCLFIRKSDTPVVKSTSKELSYFLLISIGMCFADTFILIGRPNTFQCNLLVIALGTTFTLYIGTLIIKTNRISRIFNAKKFVAAKNSRFMSTFSIKYQFFIIFVLLIIQVGLQVAWANWEPVTVVFNFYDKNTFIECDYGTLYIGPLVTIIYLLLLAVICFYQAFKIRKLPEQFNDASFIAFSMLTTVLIWCTFFPIYVTSRSRIRLVICGLAFIFNGLTALGCMFVPKIWIIFFRPEKNVKQKTLPNAMKIAGRIRLAPKSSPSTSSLRRNIPSDEKESSFIEVIDLLNKQSISEENTEKDHSEKNATDKTGKNDMSEIMEIKLINEIGQLTQERDEASNSAEILLESIEELDAEYKDDITKLFNAFEKEKQELYDLVTNGFFSEREFRDIINEVKENLALTDFFSLNFKKEKNVKKKTSPDEEERLIKYNFIPFESD